MKQGIVLLLSLLLLSSCATICNSELQRVQVLAGNGYHVVKVDSSALRSKEDSSCWYVYRQKAPFTVIVANDSIRDTLRVKSHLNAAFVLGNFFGNYGFGYLVDLRNNRRFSYPRTVSIQRDFANNLYVRRAPRRSDQHPAGKISFAISWGIYNQLYVPFPAGKVGMDGFMTGINTGLDYCITDHDGVVASFGMASAADYPMGFEYSYDDGGTFEQSGSIYGSLRYFHSGKTQALRWSAGLCYMKTTWQRSVYYSYRDQFYFFSTNQLLGAECSGEFRFTDYFGLGLNYRPMLLQTDGRTLEVAYAHSITAGLIFNIGLFRIHDDHVTPAFGKSPR